MLNLASEAVRAGPLFHYVIVLGIRVPSAQLFACMLLHRFVRSRTLATWKNEVRMHPLTQLLTRRFPWEKADITDSRFNEFLDWQKRKTTRTPREFKRFTPRLLRMMRRLMEPKPTKRYPVTEVNKYYGDRWLMVRSPRTSKVSEIWDPATAAAVAGHDKKLGDELLQEYGKEQRIQNWIMSGAEGQAKESQ